jgi:hypothetical protein
LDTSCFYILNVRYVEVQGISPLLILLPERISEGKGDIGAQNQFHMVPRVEVGGLKKKKPLLLQPLLSSEPQATSLQIADSRKKRNPWTSRPATPGVAVEGRSNTSTIRVPP